MIDVGGSIPLGVTSFLDIWIWADKKTSMEGGAGEMLSYKGHFFLFQSTLVQLPTPLTNGSEPYVSLPPGDQTRFLASTTPPHSIYLLRNGQTRRET